MSRINNKFLLKVLLLVMGFLPIMVSAADPYLQSASSTGITISWNDTQNIKSVVRYGTKKSLKGRQMAAELPSVMSKDKVWHSVRLKGLKPNTTYYYQCVTGKVKSKIFNFKTFPGRNAAKGKFRVVVYGDNRSNPTAHKSVIDGMLETVTKKYGADIHNQLDLVINVGDILNSGGNLNGYTREYFAPIKELSKSVPFMVSIGNHEGDNPFFFNYMDYNACKTPKGDRAEKYYAFRAGPILFLIINSSKYTDATQLAWIEDQLISAEADDTIDWVMGFCHHPGHSEVWPAGNTGWVQNGVIPLLASNSYPKVCGLYYGHSHDYEIGAHLEKPIRLILSGGAGGPLDRWAYYNNIDYPEIYKSFDHFGYTILEFDLAKKRYTGDTYSLGHKDKVLKNVKLDSFYQDRRRMAAPKKPVARKPPMGIPVKLMASKYMSRFDRIMSSQFQVTKTPGDYSKPVIDKHRDWVNFYQDSGAPDYKMVNQNAGINLERLLVTDGLVVDDKVAWRVRYRNQNLLWSKWSDEVAFTVKSKRASHPSPAVNSFVGLQTKLSWDPATGAKSRKVYFGTKPRFGKSDFRGKTNDTTFALPKLRPNTTYYWRIDEISRGRTVKGFTWKFSVSSDHASGYTFSSTKGVTLKSIAPGKAGWKDTKTDLADNVSYNIFKDMDNQGQYWDVKLGFKFKYCGQTFTHISPRSDGYVALTNGSYKKPGTDYPGQVSHPAFKNVLALLWTDIRTSCAVRRTGKPGKYVMTIELYDIDWDTGSGATNQVRAQIKIHEATGVVQMIYDVKKQKHGKGVTHIGISDNGTTFLSVNPTSPASASSSSTYNVETNVGLGKGSGNGKDVMFTFDPIWPKSKKNKK